MDQHNGLDVTFSRESLENVGLEMDLATIRMETFSCSPSAQRKEFSHNNS